MSYNVSDVDPVEWCVPMMIVTSVLGLEYGDVQEITCPSTNLESSGKLNVGGTSGGGSGS